MKRPVTSLCRRPGKKDRLRGSLSPVWEQFPPTGALCGGQPDLPGKSRPNEGLKTVLGEAGGCVQAAPMGEGRTSCAGWCLEGAALSTRWSRGYARAQKQPRRGPGTVCRLRPHGGAADIVCGVVPGRHRTGHPVGQGAHPGAKTAPGGGRRLSGCGIWVLLAPGDPCDLDAQGGQHSQAEDHAQLSQGEICHQEQAMQSGDQQHSQEQQHAHAEGSQ